MRFYRLMAACAALSACGGGGGNAGNASEGNAPASSSASASSSDATKAKAWLAAPCTMVSKDWVGKAIGTTVESENPIPAKGAGDADASCNYKLANGGFVNTDFTYRDGYFDAAEIASRRTIMGGEQPLQDVAGVGDDAFWDPGRVQLTVFRGGDEQAVFNLSKPDSGDPKAMAVAMAKAAGY